MSRAQKHMLNERSYRKIKLYVCVKHKYKTNILIYCLWIQMKWNLKRRKRMRINFRVFRYVWVRREGNGIGKGVSILWNIFFLWKQIWKGQGKMFTSVKSVDGGYMCVYYPLYAWDISALNMYKLEILKQWLKKKKAEMHQLNQSEVVTRL